MMCENVVCNGLLDKVNIHSVAVGNFVGLSKLHLQDLTSGSAAHTESKEQLDMTDEGFPVVWSEGIVTVTIDYICDHLGVVPNTMKIDTDGNEGKILEGAAKTLLNINLRNIVIEMPKDEAKRNYCYNALESAGFHLEWSDKDNTINEIWVK